MLESLRYAGTRVACRGLDLLGEREALADARDALT